MITFLSFLVSLGLSHHGLFIFRCFPHSTSHSWPLGFALFWWNPWFCWRSPEDKNLLEEESVRNFELLTNDHRETERERESYHWSLPLNLELLRNITCMYIYASSKTNVRWFDVPKQWNMTAILKTVDYFFRAHWHKNPVVPQAAAAFWGYSGFPTSYG